jgi:protein-S-isoprenylcysteine O-methyltransferase Ste14
VSDFFAPFLSMPGYALAAFIVLLLYGIQAEVRFGARARAMRSGPADRNSTAALSLAAAVPVVGFVLAMKSNSPDFNLPAWFRGAVIPGLPGTGWFGTILAVCGLALRMWAVLTLKHRYTRTLLIQDDHSIERGGPYRFARHPGYLGSLLTLNGVALASGNSVTFFISLLATFAAYSYRIRVEDRMLVAELGPAYDEYRRQVGALTPWG